MVRPNRTWQQVLSGWVLVSLLILHGSRSSSAADAEANWRAAGTGRGDHRSLGDRSGQIIKEQDAEEGQLHHQGWRAPQSGPYSEAAAAQPKPRKRSQNSNDHLPDHSVPGCDDPQPPENGYLQGARRQAGSVVHVRCEEGFALSGPSNLTCVATGSRATRPVLVWLPALPITCLRVFPEEEAARLITESETLETEQHQAPETEEWLCEAPPPPANGFLEGEHFERGSVVTVTCERGFVLRGPERLTCVPDYRDQSVGVWLPQDQYYCVELEFDQIKIHTLKEEMGEGPQYAFSDTDNYNYILDPSEFRHRESVKAASYEDAHCPQPSAPAHGSVEGSDVYIGASISYHCDSGYSLVGPEGATCFAVPDPFRHRGIWDPPELPYCRANPGSVLPLMMMKTGPEGLENRIYQTDTHRRTDSRPSSNFVEGLPPICSLPRLVGPCAEVIPRYYFNTTLHECLPFIYGGCGGNENNFHTLRDCLEACG